jgi:diguanylate cyclase (GGDEF)-like protein/PAS domain S-box-containing protein
MERDSVLIVDDEPININTVVQILLDKYELKVATSAKVALEIIDTDKPDLILLDINMPVMNGYEMAKILKNHEENHSIPFIFLTANSEPESIKKGFEHGAVDYISKPFSKEELQARVETHLKIHKLQNSLSHTVLELESKVDELGHYLDIIDQNVLSSTTNLHGVINGASEAFCNFSGYTKDELIGQKHDIVRHEDMDNSVFCDLWDTITNDKTWSGEVKNKRKDGSSYWISVKIFPEFDDNNEKIGYMAIRQDITDKKRIEELSIRDELTQLYNRRYFNEIFPLEINRSARDKKDLYFMMIDVDKFKLYNDNYGHQEGDNVLAQIGMTLNACAKRADDFAFRLGGEEFGMLYSSDTQDEAIIFAKSVKDKIKQLNITHKYNKPSEVTTVSIGLICKKPMESLTVEELYKLADEFLYKAKENGRDNVQFG